MRSPRSSRQAVLVVALTGTVSGCSRLVSADFDGVHPRTAGAGGSTQTVRDATTDVAPEGPLPIGMDAGHEADARSETVEVGPDACPPILPTTCGAALWPLFSGDRNQAIPYEFGPGVTVERVNTVAAAMQEWTNATMQLIPFIPRGNEPRYVRFVDVVGCGGAVRSEFGPSEFAVRDCTDDGTLLHELGRLIGLSPTHQRSDRDRYLEVSSSRAPECFSDGGDEFALKCDPLAYPGGDFGVFDFRSIMLRSGFSQAGNTTHCGTPPNGDRSFVKRGVIEGPALPCESDVVADWNASRITPGDVAAVAELYVTQSAWLPFRSMGRDVDPMAPLDIQFERGVTVDGTPALAALRSAQLRAFAKGTDGAIWIAARGPTGAWSPWDRLGSPGSTIGGVSDPAAVAWSQDESRIDVVVVADRVVQRSTFHAGSWSPWEASIGAPPGGAESPPAITSGAPDMLDVYVTGADGQVWINEWKAQSWSNWSRLAVLPAALRVSGGPAADARGPDQQDLVVRASDGGLYYLSASGGWAPNWLQIAEPGVSGTGRPAVCSWGLDRLDVFFRGQRDLLWQIACGSRFCGSLASWTPFYLLGGLLAGDPAASAPRDTYRLDVIAPGNDGAALPVPSAVKGLWHKSWEP